MTTADDVLAPVVAYHDGTKHHYSRFARSLGYLDWQSQPQLFRSFAGARVVPLFPSPDGEPLAAAVPSRSYDALFDVTANNSAATGVASLPVTTPAIGYFLRHALGLSAWKALRDSRWPLRVNPSSGNLHPTEAFVIDGASVWHYAPDRHALEERCRFAAPAWTEAFLVVLTSIHWREAWKYGERAFRYCQHDAGHAIAALRLSAALCGWRATVLADWTHADLSGAVGLDREADYLDAEPEEPACAMLVGAASAGDAPVVGPLVEAIRRGHWTGRASQLSEAHVQWTFIDTVASATRSNVGGSGLESTDLSRLTPNSWVGVRRERSVLSRPDPPGAAIMLQRRSAMAFDGTSCIDRDTFVHMLARVTPGDGPPWDALWWTPRIHLVLFVHRVTGFEPGLYLLPRSDHGEALLRSAVKRQFTWERVDDRLPLYCLASGDCRRLAQRVSCDQDIASAGFFSLGMLADFDGSLREFGPSFYRNLFWESGVVGQVLYLEAEAAGTRGTGIGCFYDDGVHEVLGIETHAVQSLYHFTVGSPVEDGRLTTEPGYRWETKGGPGR